jgi:hypothetical protein
MNLRQRLDSLEQTLQPGRFLVVCPDPSRDRDEQLEAFRAENEVMPRDTLVVLRRFDFDERGLPVTNPTQRPPEARRKATPCSPASMIA